MPAADPKYESFTSEKSTSPQPFYKKISHDTKLIIVAIIYLVSGMIYLHYHNGFQFLTALYALIEIVTTIGYGDVTFAETNFGKIFMSFYVMVGLTVVAGVLTKVAEKVSEAAENAFRAKMRKAQMKTSGMTEDQVKSRFGESNELLFAAASFGFMVLFGTLFYVWYESCTCSYGLTAVANCVDGVYDTCVATGGYQKSFIDSFYMSCITLTTVGFGDFAPKSQLGRAVGIFWMLFGVVITANFITELTSKFLEAEKQRKNYGKISYETFSEIDKDGNGTLSKYEFVSFVLLQYGLVKKEDLDEIIKMYEKLDVSGDGIVTYEDIESAEL